MAEFQGPIFKEKGKEGEGEKGKGKEKKREGVNNFRKTTPPSSDGWLRT